MGHTAKSLRTRIVFLAGLLLASYPLLPNLDAREQQAGGASVNQAPRMINQPTDPALRGTDSSSGSRSRASGER